MTRYDYKELREAAVKNGATREAINALGAWFEQYGADAWNGEYYDADEGLRLFPVYDYDAENGEYSAIGYEFR